MYNFIKIAPIFYLSLFSIAIINLNVNCNILAEVSRGQSVGFRHKSSLLDCDAHGNTALMLAVIENNIEKINLLLANKSDVNAVNGCKETALMLATYKGFTEIVELLLARKADFNIVDLMGNTALMYAVEKKHKKIVQLLLKSGADVERVSALGETALDIAYENNEPEIIKLLKDEQARIEFIRKEKIIKAQQAMVIKERQNATTKILIDNNIPKEIALLISQMATATYEDIPETERKTKESEKNHVSVPKNRCIIS